jgi:NTE family protein
MLAAARRASRTATTELARLWSELRVDQVYRSDVLSLTSGGLRWLQDLSLGGFFGGGGAQSLLDATPLRAFIGDSLPLAGIGQAIRDGHLYALAVSATCYYSGKSFTFVQGRPGHPLWTKSRRVTLPVEIALDHILASAAIPIVFAPVLVKTELGDFYFGDGALRLVTPFSPAIRLGADRVLANRHPLAADGRGQAALVALRGGRRGRRAAVDAEAAARADHRRDPERDLPRPPRHRPRPPAADERAHLLLRRALLRPGRGGRRGSGGNLRSRARTRAEGRPTARLRADANRPALRDQPVVDLAQLAQEFEHRMPRMVRFAMEGLGASKAQSAALLSYLCSTASTRAR